MKPTAPDDPMQLVGVRLPRADPRVMARCVVEEYLLLGWDERQLMLLFSRPRFAATHSLYRQLGEAGLREVIEEVRRQWTGDRCGQEARHA